ncbi:MAG: hypothetical protein A3D50_00110 [Candidatus Taylorbacteria bacterium RIFCSPHIGHO2_02_FULL_44_12]|uniref:PhnB-like domain-containing protein n=1 Tax=Candidatus Taylorbacteria bacterium RIFCSPHIGHO2_02_FULL_44_12 TaxID=1802308 RepID=A0A1G2MKK7_9BACT|nr:MAG: hypothetical protein A3D50_00110 [Candidatus Taylorbacteria bacterium RIFCSPHIGHO2_02_FULL_44_12]
MELRTYLRFNDGRCREAMNFYKECFGGELTFQTAGESPMANEIPPESHDKIMESCLKIGRFEIYGSDMFRDKATVGDNFSMRVKVDSEKELNSLFGKLALGGEIFMKPEKMSWGEIHGMVTDKYGIEWGVVTSNVN